ncbi:MAG: CopG family transcriptional regulator [Bacteroidetes bacterium]|nr:CopG family transcriptional regulator [Bacteroidota bacterium]
MPKKVLLAIPPAMLECVDDRALKEHRTRSDLIREALRAYLSRPALVDFRSQNQIEATPAPAVGILPMHTPATLNSFGT